MALPSFCTRTVTVERAPLVQSRSGKSRDWSQAVPHDVGGCWLQVGSSATAGTDWSDARQAASEIATLFAPPGSDIAEADRIAYDSKEWSVDGIPRNVESPTGAVAHIECDLVRWRG